MHGVAVQKVPLELVYVGPDDQLNVDPVALITPTDGQFGHEFSAGEKLRELTQASTPSNR